MTKEEEVMRAILAGFVNDPPDTEFQEGYLSAMLTFANEVMGIPNTDPLWAQADFLLDGDDPSYVSAAQEAKAKRQPFGVIDGGKA